jgi:hypothetical protein
VTAGRTGRIKSAQQRKIIFFQVSEIPSAAGLAMPRHPAMALEKSP